MRTSDRWFYHWLGVLAFTLVLIALRGQYAWLVKYPVDWQIPLAQWLNALMTWFGAATGQFFRGIAWLLSFPVSGIKTFLHAVPWAVLIAACAIVAHYASGIRLAIFTTLALLYMVVIGYWTPSMNSLALVAISVPLALAVGFGVGVMAFLVPRTEKAVIAMLDLFQTIPAFAYLIPILLLFGFGPVVGLIASLLFAFPPMVRNTMLGLRSVPPEVVESGLMSGATPLQLFWLVQVPSALRQILLGANQSTMAALSMVIIASVIGGTEDIGWVVLSGIRKALFGESLLSGIVIALIAMILDRITVGLATRTSGPVDPTQPFHKRHPHLTAALILLPLLWALSVVVPALRDYPEGWVISIAKPLNEGIAYFVLHYKAWIETVKSLAYFYLMLPMRVGLEQTVSPFSWGFTLTFAHKIGYLVLVVAAAAAALAWLGRAAAVGLALFGIVFYFGITGMPWPAVTAVLLLLAYQAGGAHLTVGVGAAAAFLLLTGIWPEAMMSVYLCGLGVLICFLLGSVIGIWAAHNDRVSRFIRPINDTLQTMPLFVLLIPAVMIFKLGDFTALIAIIIYAIVPMIRYAEHGLRSLPKTVIEAAESMGTTPTQMLFQVKLPLALPVIMLGLNQTVLYGISMLVITALVGTNDLGQRVYIGLGDGDFGKGMIAGLGMAFLAMVADRIIQAAVKKRQQALGMA